MHGNRIQVALVFASVLGLFAPMAEAQWDDPEAGLSEPATTNQPRTARPARNTGGTRLGMQARFDAINVPWGAADVHTPFITPGARILDGRLFLGAGVGMFGNGSRGFSLSPLANFDFHQDEWGAIYAAGWLTLGREVIGPASTFRWGTNGGLGVKGQLIPALSVGTEWGWGFSMAGSGNFQHGIFGTVVIEATIGL